MKTICIYNNKGGVGKTSVVGALSVELVIKGKKVLMVDSDAQANLTNQFMRKMPIEKELADYLRDDSIGLENCILRTPYENLYIVPTIEYSKGGQLSTWKVSDSNEDIVRYLIDDAKKLGFDYLFFDTPPAFSEENKKFMLAADEIIPVLEIAKSSMDGLVNYYVGLKKLRGRSEKPVSNKLIFNKYEKTKAVQKALIPGIMALQSNKYLIPTDQAFKKAELNEMAVQEIGMKDETQEVLNKIIADIEGE